MPTTCVGVLGRKGMGKSTLLRTIVLGHVKKYSDIRFHVWDTTREWVQRPRLTVYPGHLWDLEEVAEQAIADAPAVLVVDEIDRVAPNHSGGLPVGSALHEIVHYGRHLRVGLLWATRRSADVHQSLMALADTIYFFHLSHPRDIETVAKHCGPAWATTVQRLNPHERVRYDP